jgi:hypothetical protein
MNKGVDRAKFLMSYDNRTTLNENAQNYQNGNSHVIMDWLSPDEKYFIFLDELYDIENKSKIGNIWENFDNFKIFLRHSFEVATNIPQQLKESFIDRLDNQLLIESKTNYLHLKPILRKIINEESWTEWGWNKAKGFGNWMYEKGAEAYKGVSDFVATSYEGAKDLLGHISRGEWNEVVSLLGAGALYFARRLRDAMYHPVGMILDIMLVASGIGKTVQWVPWAIIVALDIYEIVENDFEDKLPEGMEWLRYLFLGLDVMCLVLSAGVVSSIRTALTGVRTERQVLDAIGRENLKTMASAAAKAPGILTRAAEWLATRFPAGSTFIKGILGSVQKIVNTLLFYIKRILTPKSIASGALTGGLIYSAEKGMEKAGEYFSGGSEKLSGDTMAQIPNLMSGDAEYTV